MPVAVTLRVAARDETALDALRDAIAAFETEPSIAAIGYAPHLTLALYDTDEGLDLEGVVRRIPDDTDGVCLSFDAIRWFDGPPPVAWAAPQPHQMLDAMQARLHASVDPARCHPHHRPGAWVPHCTLGNRIDPQRMDAARAFAKAWRGPVHVDFDRLEIVAFPPVTVRLSQTLRPLTR